MIFPFNDTKRSGDQRLASIILMVIGVVTMIFVPVIRLNEFLAFQGFVVGILVTLVGFVYFMDVK